MAGILGRKAGMTRIFQDNGKILPVTLISCAPSKVTHIKTAAKDGYEAVVLGFEPLKKPRKTKKFRFLREFRIGQGESFKVDDAVTVDSFKEVQKVNIVGISKGKGFQGTIKRWHFSSGPGSHGSHFKREPGSVGARAKPGRIHRGKKMAGRMGGDRVTRRNVPLVQIDSEHQLLVVSGAVPGPRGALVMVSSI